MNISVLVAHNIPSIRMSICNILAGTEHFSVAGEADSAASAIDVAQSVPWDIAIVSAAFNDRDGCTVVRRLRQDSTSANILMVGLYESEIGSQKAIGAGANGYLSLICEPLDLITSLVRLASLNSCLNGDGA